LLFANFLKSTSDAFLSRSDRLKLYRRQIEVIAGVFYVSVGLERWLASLGRTVCRRREVSGDGGVTYANEVAETVTETKRKWCGTGWCTPNLKPLGQFVSNSFLCRHALAYFRLRLTFPVQNRLEECHYCWICHCCRVAVLTMLKF